MTELAVGPGMPGDTNVESSTILSEAQQPTASSTDSSFSAPVDTLDAALWYAAQGLGVFALQPGTKRPFGVTNGVKDATTDADRIREMWGRFPNADIGMALSDALGAVDIDQ